MTSTGCRLTLVGLLLFLGLAGAQEKELPAVRDEAKLFGAETVEKASASLSKLREKHRVKILIETVPAIPAEVKDTGSWARERRADRNVDIYIVISNKPKRFEITADSKLAEAGLFGQADVKELTAVLSEGLRKDRDIALEKAATYLADRLNLHAKAVSQLKDIAGTWGGPMVDVVAKGKKTKAWLFLRFKADKQPTVDVGYLTPPDKGAITGYETKPIELKEGEKRQIEIANFDDDGRLVLNYEVKEGVLHLSASRKARLPFVPGGSVDLSGEWKRPKNK